MGFLKIRSFYSSKHMTKRKKAKRKESILVIHLTRKGAYSEYFKSKTK